MTYKTSRKINVRTIRNIAENDGLTLRNGKIIKYKTGWQVAYMGIKCKTPEEVSKLIHGNGLLNNAHVNIGIWLHEGIYYVDISKRYTTKKEALAVGELCDQQSIYGWAPRKHGQLVWCE